MPATENSATCKTAFKNYRMFEKVNTWCQLM